MVFMLILTYDLSGILTLHLDRESYERSGLTGKPDGVKGSRGIKPWWGEENTIYIE
jgi:hypothetical protein